MPCPLMFGHLCHPGISRLSIEYVGMTFHWLRKIIIKRTHPFNLATPQDVIGTIKSISLLEGRQVYVTSICMHKATALNYSQSFKFSSMPLIDHRTIFIILWWLKEYHYAFLKLLANVEVLVGYQTTVLTHWGRMTHICVSEVTSIGSDNGSSPGQRQGIIWTNTAILIIGPMGTNFSEILIEILTLSLKKTHFNVSSAKWRPFCLGLNVLTRNI